MDFLEAYTKNQQRVNREKDRKKRQAPTARDIRNYRLIQIGALWNKNFPESKEINPYNPQHLAGIARVFALLASDPRLAWIRRFIIEAIDNNTDNRE